VAFAKGDFHWRNREYGQGQTDGHETSAGTPNDVHDRKAGERDAGDAA
jgi:hypothetical protein